MPQPKSSGASKSRAKAGKGKTSSSSSSPKKAVSAGAKRAGATPAKKKTSPRATTSTPTAMSSSPSPEEPLGAALATVREHLARGLMFTGERLQETIDDTVRRGRMTRKDAEDLAQRLVSAGRRQTEELLCELEQVVERGGGEFVRASRRVRDKLR